MTFLRKSGSRVVVWMESLATAAWCSFCSGSRSHRKNFAMTFFILRACIKISDTIVFEIPASASSSRSVSCWSLLIATLTYATFSGVVLVASLSGCGSLSTDSQPCLKHLCHIFICSALIALSTTSFWIIRIISKVECSSLKQNFDADSLLYLLSHFECDGHTVYICSFNSLYQPHWLVQWSHHCSCMCIPVHSPWLPGYIDATQTVLVMLTVAGLFLDRPRISLNYIDHTFHNYLY